MDRRRDDNGDADLWHNFTEGDQHSFKELYSNNINQLFKYGTHITKDKELIFDAIQDLFIDLYNYKTKLHTIENIKPYLYISLKRKIIKLQERLKKQNQLELNSIPFCYLLNEDLTEESEQHDQLLNQLTIALGKLTDRQREAIYLKYALEMTYEEIGEILHINYQSARNLIFRSMENLRTQCKQSPILLILHLKSKI